MKRILSLICAIVFVSAMVASAEGEAAAPAPAKEKQELKDITVTGTLIKEEGTNAKGEKTVKYVLNEANGNQLSLPKVKDTKEGKPEIDLASLVGKNVTVVGKGIEKNGKIMIKKLISVEEVKTDEGANPPPPAAPDAAK